MNKMKRMYVIWGMLVVGLFILLTIFGFFYKKKTQVYKELENEIVKAEDRYVDEKFLYPEQNEIVKTKVSTLIDNGYLDSLEVNGEVCEGYATVRKKGAVYDYKGYIKCANYKTKGYQD